MSESLRFGKNFIKEVNESNNSVSSDSNEGEDKSKNPPIPLQPVNSHTNPPSTITV